MTRDSKKNITGSENGPDEAFLDLLRRRLRIWAAKHRVPSSVQEEIVSDAISEALTKYPSMSRVDTGRTAFGIAKKRWAMIARKAGTERAHLERVARRPESGVPAPPPEVIAAEEARKEAFRTLVEALSPEERQVLLLRFGRDVSYEEIGRLLGVSSDAARQRTSRALRALRELLSRNDDAASK